VETFCGHFHKQNNLNETEKSPLTTCVGGSALEKSTLSGPSVNPGWIILNATVSMSGLTPTSFHPLDLAHPLCMNAKFLSQVNGSILKIKSNRKTKVTSEAAP
jgi:hypothetical protein